MDLDGDGRDRDRLRDGRATGRSTPPRLPRLPASGLAEPPGVSLGRGTNPPVTCGLPPRRVPPGRWLRSRPEPLQDVETYVRVSKLHDSILNYALEIGEYSEREAADNRDFDQVKADYLTWSEGAVRKNA